MGKRKAAMAAELGKKKKICKETDDPAPENPDTGCINGLEQGGKSIENYMLRKDRQRASMQRPKVFLTMEKVGVEDKLSEQPADEKTETRAPQLYVRDLQYLLIYALRRGLNYDQPRWCCMLRPGKMSAAMLIVLQDVSIVDFQQHRDCFAFLEETFSEKLRVQLVNPCQYFSSFNFDMYAVPMSASQLKGFKRKHGSTSHRNGIQVVFPRLPSAADGSGKVPDHGCGESDKEEGAQRVGKTGLLLSVAQMVEENYPVPDEEDAAEKYAGYVMSKEKYSPVTPDSPLFAVDCEMCLTSSYKHELTRVSIVNEQNEVIYDELVKPYNPIINYLTRFSGITKRLLEPVTKRIEDVQREIGELLPGDAILCGQSLGNDLCALKMFHPYVVDTSLIYNLSGSRRMKCSLKRLAFCFLGRVIQESRGGHSSAEDAKATMDLVLLKLSKTLAFGDAVLGGNVTPFLPSFPSSSENPLQTPSMAEEPVPAGTGDKGMVPESTDSKSQTSGSPKTTPQDPSPPDVMMRSLFDLLSDLGVAACQVGGQRLVTRYQGEPGLRCCQTDSDEDARQKAEELCQDCRFTWVEFSAFAKLLAAQETTGEKEGAGGEVVETGVDVKKKKRVLKTLDKHIRKVAGQLPEKCLVTVVLTGRSSQQQQQQPAAAFLHIT